MADNAFNSGLDGDVYLTLTDSISLSELADALVKSPDFINQLRNALLKDARKLGNSLGSYAQAVNPTAANTTRRIQ
jgi:hypothetical protein